MTQTAYFMEEKTYLELVVETAVQGRREGEEKRAVKDTMGKVISFRKNAAVPAGDSSL